MVEAKLNKEYALRIAGVGLMMVGICVWSIYDGTVAWPRHNANLEQMRPELLATNLTAEAWVARGEEGEASPMEAAFEAQGLKTPSKLVKKLAELEIPAGAENRAALLEKQAEQVAKTLAEPVYSAADLKTQFVQAGVTLALGLWAFAVIAMRARKRYTADEKGLGGNGMDGEVPYDEIAAVDWAKWDDKGIAVLALKSGKRHKLDAWHYAGITEIIEEIKTHRPDLVPPAKEEAS